MRFPLISKPVEPLYLLRAAMIARPITSSATAFEFCPGVFSTTTPAAVAALRSTLSYPAPARTTIFRLGAALNKASSTLSERTISALTVATASRSSSFDVYFSRSANSCPASSITLRMPSTAVFEKGSRWLQVLSYASFISGLLRNRALHQQELSRSR